MTRYWVVRMTMYDDESDPFEFDYEIAQNNNFIGIGWRDMGDLTRFSEEDRGRLKEELKITYPDESKGKIGQHAGEIIRFVDNNEGIDVEDIVILPTYTEDDTVYLIGKIKSSAYYMEKPQDKAHVRMRRDVEWIMRIPKDRLSTKFKQGLMGHHAVYEIDKHEEEIQALLNGGKFETKPVVIERKTDMIGKLSVIQKRLMDISPNDFEQLVCETLSLKYDVKAVKTRDVADGGTDFVCINDLGDTVYRGQVKRVSTSIGNKDILQLRGTLRENQEGIFVTTTHFTTSAIEESDSLGKKKIHLIGGTQLSQTILDIYEDLDDKFKDILKINSQC